MWYACRFRTRRVRTTPGHAARSSVRRHALAAVLFGRVVVRAALGGGGADDGVDVDVAFLHVGLGVAELDGDLFGLGGEEGELGLGGADELAVRLVALVEFDLGAGREHGGAEVADDGDEGEGADALGVEQGDDGVGGGEGAVGLLVLAVVVEAGFEPVGRLDLGDRAVLVDVGDIVYKGR